EPALTRAEIEVSVAPELAGKRRQFRWAVHVVPVRIVDLEIGDRIGLTEAIDLEGWLLRRRGDRTQQQKNECSEFQFDEVMLARSHALTLRLASSKRRT